MSVIGVTFHYSHSSWSFFRPIPLIWLLSLIFFVTLNTCGLPMVFAVYPNHTPNLGRVRITGRVLSGSR